VRVLGVLFVRSSRKKRKRKKNMKRERDWEKSIMILKLSGARVWEKNETHKKKIETPSLFC
jgi:hypothetical protein